MPFRPRASSLILAAAALALSVVQVVWIATVMDASDDGTAYAMSLLGSVAAPTCIAAGAVRATGALDRWTQVLGIAAVAAIGGFAAGIVAGVFVGDDSEDPAWIRWFADATVPALLVGAVLALALFRRLLGPLVLLRAARWAASVVCAVSVALVVGIAAVQVEAVWLASILLLGALLVLRRTTLRSRRVRSGAGGRRTSGTAEEASDV